MTAHAPRLQSLSDAELEAHRLDLIRRGDLMCSGTAALRAVQKALRAVAVEQTRRAAERETDPFYWN